MRSPSAVVVALLFAGNAFAVGSPDLSVTLYVPISRVNVGQTFAVEARIFDSGDTDVRYVWPCPYLIMVTPPWPDCMWMTSGGGGSVAYVDGPLPQSQAYLTPGMTTSFLWTYIATSTGTVDFTVTAMGREVGGPGMPKTAGTVTIIIQNPAALSATVTTSSPGIVRYGDTVTVYLDVFNHGDASSDGTVRFSVTVAGTGRLTPIGCPPLANLCPDDPGRRMATIGHDSATLFVWMYRVDAPGSVTIFVAAGGLDHNSGAVVLSNSTSTTFVVPVPSIMSYTVTGAEGVVQGEVVTCKVAIANLGATPVCQSGFNLRIEDQGRTVLPASLVLEDLGDSLLPICYEPGQVRTFTVKFTVPKGMPPGAGTLVLEPVAAEAWTGTPAIAVGNALPLMVVAGRSGFCGFSANPWRPRSGPVRVCYAVSPEDGGRPVSVSVYTLAGELVRTLRREALPTGVYQAVWDGKNTSGQTLASGVYIVFFQSFLAKDTRKLAVLQ